MKYIRSLLPVYEPADAPARLPSVELAPVDCGATYAAGEFNEPKAHQLLPIRYMAPHTPYDRLMLVHDPGSGKTFVAYAVIAMYARLRLRTIVLTPTPCDARRHLLALNAKRKREACIRDYFKVLSYGDVERMPRCAMDAAMVNYSLLIADEMHVLPNQRKRAVFPHRFDKNHEFVEACQRRGMRLLEMTATPQHRVVKFDERLQLAQLFTTLSGRQIESLEDIRALRGYTSVYRSAQPAYVRLVDEGRPYAFADGSESRTRVVVDELRGYQRDRCAGRHSADDEIFCAPREALADAAHLRDNMWQYSALYHRIFAEMGLYDGDARKQREVTLVFHERVKGSGNDRLRRLFRRAFDFEEVRDVDAALALCARDGPPRARVCLVSGTIGHTDDESIAKAVAIVSHANNKYGQHIRVVIVSIKGAFQLNWKNVRALHVVLTPLPGVMRQAIGRGFRGQTAFEGDENYLRLFVHLVECENRVEHLRTLERRMRVGEQLNDVLDEISIERAFAPPAAGAAGAEAADCQFMYDSLYNGYTCANHFARTRRRLQALLDGAVYSLHCGAFVASRDACMSRNDAAYALTRVIKTGVEFGDAGGERYALSTYRGVLYFASVAEERRRLHPLRHILAPRARARGAAAFARVFEHFGAQRPAVDSLDAYRRLPVPAKVFAFEACFAPGALPTDVRLAILRAERRKYEVVRDAAGAPAALRHRLLPYYHSKPHAIYVGAGGARELVAGRWRWAADAPQLRVRAPPAPPPASYPLDYFFARADGVVKRYAAATPGKGQSLSSIRNETKLRYVDDYLAAAAQDAHLRDRLAAEWPAAADWDDVRRRLARLVGADDFFIRLQRAVTGFVA